jgi:pre-mRNA 3'-end-processing factor FIP1
MVMTGASAMMNNAANQGMMAPGVMMDMGMIGAMGSMGLNGDMAAAIGGQMMQGMMPPDGGAQGGQQAGPGAAVSQEVGMMQDSAFNPAHAAAGSGMMNIGMGGDYVIQVGYKLWLLFASFCLILEYRNRILWYNKCIR